MLYRIVVGVVVLGVYGLAATGMAGERIDHFQGEPAETIEQALDNFSEYNRRLAVVLQSDPLSARDLATIHQLTYTLENALEKLNGELSALADTLEALHIASETADFAGSRTHGDHYLNTARQFAPQAP